MTTTIDIATVELITRCRAERGKSNGFSWCWELFRRALVEDDQQAWEALYPQYHRLIGKWASESKLNLDDLTAETFSRFWKGMRNHQFVNRFSTIGAVMAYLKHCARSVTCDEIRDGEREQRLEAALIANSESPLSGDPTENVEDKIFNEERQAYLQSRLNDDIERLVYQSIWRTGLKPQELAQTYPNHFPTVKEVYKIQERIIKRLTNDPIAQEFWR